MICSPIQIAVRRAPFPSSSSCRQIPSMAKARIVAPLAPRRPSLPERQPGPCRWSTHDAEHYVVMLRLISFLPATPTWRRRWLPRCTSRRHHPRAGLAVLRDLTSWKPPDGSIAATAWNWPGRGWMAEAQRSVFLPGFRSDMTGDKATALAAFCAERGQAMLRFDYSGPWRQRRPVRGRHHRPLDRRRAGRDRPADRGSAAPGRLLDGRLDRAARAPAPAATASPR